MHRRDRRLDVEVGARHGFAVVDGAGCGATEVDAADHGADSTSRHAWGTPGDTGWTGYVDGVSDTLPMFPLNTVLFPGVSVPLTVFEDRYRALVHHLLRVEDPIERVFGSVGIREGYEVGDHGAQSLYRVGCRVQLTEVEAHPDGTFDVVAVGLERIQLDRLDTTGTFPVGHVTARPDIESPVPEAVLERARIAFTAYRAALADIRSDPYSGALPRDPTYLSWTLAACRAAAPAGASGAARGGGRQRAADPRHRPAALRAARDERDPVAAGHRGGPHALVAQLRSAETKSRERVEIR